MAEFRAGVTLPASDRLCDRCRQPIPANHRAWPMTAFDPGTNHFRPMRVCFSCLRADAPELPPVQRPRRTTVRPSQRIPRMASRGHGLPATPKLTEEQVVEIRRRHAAGENQVQLGKEFGLNRLSIGRIVRHQAWPYVEDDADKFVVDATSQSGDARAGQRLTS